MSALVTTARMRGGRAVCRLVLAAMLFAQAIGIAQACVAAAPSPAMAFGQATALEPSAASGQSLALEPAQHEGDCGKTMNRNACLQQCTAGDQSSAQIQVAVAPMPVLPVLIVDAAPTRIGCPHVASSSLSRSPDPPPSIRFCSFQL